MGMAMGAPFTVPVPGHVEDQGNRRANGVRHGAWENKMAT